MIIETRFWKNPTDRTAIEKLNSKMEIRQPNTTGIYFSMSGFTENAKRYVSDIIKKRIVVLFDGIEIKGLLTSRLDLEEILRKRFFCIAVIILVVIIIVVGLGDRMFHKQVTKDIETLFADSEFNNVFTYDQLSELPEPTSAAVFQILVKGWTTLHQLCTTET